MKQRFLFICSSFPVPGSPSSKCIPFAVEVNYITTDMDAKVNISQAIARSLTQARIPARIPTRALVRRGIATNTSGAVTESIVRLWNTGDLQTLTDGERPRYSPDNIFHPTSTAASPPIEMAELPTNPRTHDTHHRRPVCGRLLLRHTKRTPSRRPDAFRPRKKDDRRAW